MNDRWYFSCTNWYVYLVPGPIICSFCGQYVDIGLWFKFSMNVMAKVLTREGDDYLQWWVYISVDASWYLPHIHVETLETYLQGSWEDAGPSSEERSLLLWSGSMDSVDGAGLPWFFPVDVAAWWAELAGQAPHCTGSETHTFFTEELAAYELVALTHFIFGWHWEVGNIALLNSWVPLRSWIYMHRITPSCLRSFIKFDTCTTCVASFHNVPISYKTFWFLTLLSKSCTLVRSANMTWRGCAPQWHWRHWSVDWNRRSCLDTRVCKLKPHTLACWYPASAVSCSPCVAVYQQTELLQLHKNLNITK